MTELNKMLDTVLSMDDPDFASKLTDALGLKKGEILEITGSQHDRTDGLNVTYIPKTTDEFEAIKLLTIDNAKKLGMKAWDKSGTNVLLLFPAEWYSSIPDGLIVTDIFGKKEDFKNGVTDDDRRYGCLAYGFSYDLPQSGEVDG